MKNLRFRSSRDLVVLTLFLFLGLFSSSRSLAQQNDEAKFGPARVSDQIPVPFDYDAFVTREKNGEFPPQGGAVPVVSPFNSLTNNNAGSTGTCCFTQSETALAVFGNTVVVGFNDSGSNAGGTNKFTGFARSTDGGATFTDGGTLPTNPNGDAGDPVMARSESSGRIFFSTLQFSGSSLDVFHSDDGGLTWSAPVSGAPGKTGTQDKEWIVVDNFAGAGNGNLYLIERDFGPGAGIYFFRSTDNGNTFGPSGGTLITSGNQGAFVAVGPDHAVYAFWLAGATLQMRKSTDLGLTFVAPVTVASGLIGGTNGDLGLTGLRQGTATPAGFRTSEFPHAAVNPLNGNIYVTYNNKGAGSDKADVLLVQSTNGGATWAAPILVNDDATTTDQWQPTIAVTPDGQNLGIFYYSRQEDPVNNNLFKYYGRVGSISGSVITFSPSFAISNVASLPEFGRDSVVNSTYMGDYNQAVGTSGAFHVVWSDNRDDLPGGAPRKDPNVYYKQINLTLHVTTTVPVVGSILSTAPIVFTINVSEPVNPASLQASDFSVNGIPATSVAYTPGTTTMTFTFGASPVTVQGLQTMNIAAGAFTSAAAGDPVAAFTGTFRYDVVLLQVTSTVPPVGGVFTLPGPFTYDVNFNEPVNPASAQTGDLQLSGIAPVAVTGVTVLPGNTTARFTISVPSEGTLTASIPAGVITDAFGNPGAAFTGSYSVDIGTVPYPTPLLAENPPGSLVYDPNITGNIGIVGDTDSFTIAIDPAQTITVLVAGSGGLQPRIELRNPASALIGSATAAAPGQKALLQTVPTTAGGTYTITVGGASNTTGGYTLQVILNAALEDETQLGSSNDTRATAQNLDGSFIGLQTSLSSASRGAVLGGNAAGSSVPVQTFDFESGQQGFVINNGPQSGHVAGLWHLSTGRGSQSGHSPVSSFYFGQGEGPGGGGNYNVGNTAGTITSGAIALPNNPSVGLSFNYVLGTEGNGSFDVASVQISNNGGATFTTIASSTSAAQLPLSSVWRNASFGLAAFAGQTVVIRFSFDTVDSVANTFEGWYVDDVQVAQPASWLDYYSFSASANDMVSAALKNLSGIGTSVVLENAAGTVLATGAVGPTNYDSGIQSFLIPTGGTYFLRVNGTAAAAYNLVVTRNAAFDTEANDTAATAQSLNATRAVLGHVTGSAAPLQNFDDGMLTGYTFTGVNNVSVTAAAAHDGPFGLQVGNFTEWMWRNDAAVAVQQGDTMSAWVQAVGATNGRVYVGFGASAGGTLSMVLGGNTSQLILQRSVPFTSFTTIGQVAQTWVANKWYRFEIVWGVGGSITGRLFDSDGTTLLNTVTATDTTITSGGLAFRGFGPTHYVDTVQRGGQGNNDWYSIALGSGQHGLKFETSTPADGPGEFANRLDPHIELFDNTGTMLIASGTALGDGRNESLIAAGLTSPGVYSLRVNGQGSTSGEYFLTARAYSPPTISKAFGAASIPFGGTTTLSFTINNPNPFPLSGLSFTDPLPGGLAVSSAPAVSNTCGGSFSAVAGATSVGLTGGSLAAGGSCTISVSVTGTAVGVQNNTTGNVSSTESGNGSNATASITVVQASTISALTVSPSSVQYSDQVTLMATVSPASVLGQAPATSVTFKVGTGATMQTFGPVALVADGGTLKGTLTNAQILQAAGSYTVTAEFGGVTPNFNVTNPTKSLTVTKEDAVVSLAPGYPFSVQVNTPGGTAGPLTRCVNIKEVADGSLGDISKAQPVTFTVSPIVSGPAPTQSPVTYTGGGFGGTLQACVTLSNVEVNVYDIHAEIGGNFYMGMTDFILIVFDPSLGFITGGGTVINPNTGYQANFGMNGKYLKNGQEKGSLLYIENRPTGDVILKSNAIESLSIVGTTTAILIGKGTLNGVGNYEFLATVVDNGEPGVNDRLGLQLTDPHKVIVPALTFTPAVLNGGNIQVPH